MAPIEIVHWDKHYEKADTRKCTTMHWLSLPIKPEGTKFSRIMELDPTGSVFGGFVLLLELASRGEPRRGVIGLSVDRICQLSGFSKKSMEKAIEVLASNEINWINTGFPEGFRKEAGSFPEGFRTTGHNRTGQDITGQNKNLLFGIEHSERAEKLRDHILSKDPKAKTDINKWANEVRLMVERDGRTLDEIDRVIEFSQTDSFWSNNILSMGKLRKQFTALLLKSRTPQTVIEKRQEATLEAGRKFVERGKNRDGDGQGEILSDDGGVFGNF